MHSMDLISSSILDQILISQAIMAGNIHFEMEIN